MAHMSQGFGPFKSLFQTGGKGSKMDKNVMVCGVPFITELFEFYILNYVF